MLTPATALIACLVWTALLFAVALWGERQAHRFDRAWSTIYAFSLAVHCTAWTYYGAAGQATAWQFAIPPTLIGIGLLFAFGMPFLRRLASLVRQHNSATIADLVVARLGASHGLGAVVTAVALIGIIPYIALQLRAITQGLGVILVAGGLDGEPHTDAALWLVVAMAAFTVLFGTRQASATEHNRGIILVLAFEAVWKLLALLAVGVFAVASLDGAELTREALRLPPASVVPDFIAMMGVGALAAFILPHQFHVGVVELRDSAHLKTARWLFPVYLMLIALPSLPIAMAGARHLGPDVSMDLYVLALPLASGNEGLALLVYLGSLSAATGMIILSALSLSIMMGNHWFGERMVRGATQAGGDTLRDLRPRVLAYRRVGILLVFVLAWLYSLAMSDVEALSDLGLTSFTALAQLAPAVLLAIYRPKTPSPAIIAGLVAGIVAWIYLVLLPIALQQPARGDWFMSAPFAFLFTGKHVAVGVGISLLINLACVVASSAFTRARTQAAANGIRSDALRQVAGRFLDPSHMRQLFVNAPATEWMDPQQASRVERELSAVVGAGMARLLVETSQQGVSAPLEDVARVVGEAAQALRFNQRVLEAALENMSQGISVVDSELRLVAWNRRYAATFGFPDELLVVGSPISELTRWSLQHLVGVGDLPAALSRRMDYMRQGMPHLSERTFPDGAAVEIRGNPMPGGGYVATFTDVTAFRSAEDALRKSNETLERRVEDRTARLELAVQEAKRANVAKTRFLTAVGHDLMQPLHAARLLTDAMSQHVDSEFLDSFLRQIQGALDSTDDLLSGLLDMSRLEAGGLVADPRSFALSEVLDPLALEFSVLAAERGLLFRRVNTQAWAHSDPQLLRRILQNFLANAVRYTTHGRVLLGVRREGDTLRVEVHDTGPGIAPDLQGVIFEEFRRGAGSSGPGLGLGLTIVDKIAQLLQAPVSVRSTPDRGSVFAVAVPAAQGPSPRREPVRHRGDGAPKGARVLAVDNDPAALEAIRQLLAAWDCEVMAFSSGQGAGIQYAAGQADLWLLDYHLDDGDTGIALWERLVADGIHRPTVILSADTNPETREEVRRVGLSLLAKPFKPLALRWAINHLLATDTLEATS